MSNSVCTDAKVIRLVSFDVWATLVNSNKAYKAERARLVGAATGVFDQQRANELLNMADDELDKLTIETGRQFGFEDRVQRICELAARVHLPSQEVDRLYRVVSEAFMANLPALTDESLPGIFAELKLRGLKIAVNSNTGFVTADLMRNMLQAVGLWKYVDIGLFSDEIGAAKPSPEVFAQLERRSGFAAHQIVHVGDNLMTDYHGAINAGMHGFWYKGSDNQDALPQHGDLLSRIDALNG